MSLSEEDMVLAAEHALRLDEAADRAGIRRRAAADPEFRAEIADWEEALAAMWDDVTEVAPPARAWRGIERRLFGVPRRAWQGLLPWLLAGAAAAALAVSLVLPDLGPGASAPLVVAEIATEGDALRVLAAYDPAAGGFRVERLAGLPPEGRDFELWAIGPDGVPVSLGLLPERGLAALPEDLRAEAASLTLAVSEEPSGGSPTGVPTTVLAAAPVVGL